ncbi:RluA family pseudouridine synthase [Velocimicrobium porci]|uniref:Pseudouridine synthase n=1 Tax=Velocimicrobium porci TaxID=2606634 RepID=A0A6L5XZS6_9FIRM|nr:RluA family pseudouridine synthase [Velocimicrobium porci]MSS63971.1 RluA family pseudouridine synthase [Velocimicrobium porci]
MENQLLTFLVTDEDKNKRIDKYLTEKNQELSRSYIQKLIQDGLVTKNNKILKANYKLSVGDTISVAIPAPVDLDIEPEPIPLDIIYEDDDVILINKPKNMVVHPAPGHYSGTIVNALLYHCKNNLSGINGVMRPGIVHRIDMNTTGVIVACKNDKAHNCLAKQLKEHSITRKYDAIVYGNFADLTGTIEGPIGRHPIDRKKMAINQKNGKSAVTHYTVLENLQQFSHIECMLETGRTHQIRVHMASINHPLLGDDVYGPKKTKFSYLEGQTLHARVLGFIHPTRNQYMEFEAPLPEYFNHLLQQLR